MDPSKFRPPDPGGRAQGLQRSCRWLPPFFLWFLSCSQALRRLHHAEPCISPSCWLSLLLLSLSCQRLQSLNSHSDQEAARWDWPSLPLHCQAAGALSWAALATHSVILHLLLLSLSLLSTASKASTLTQIQEATRWDFKGPAAGGLPFLSTARPRAPSAGRP